MKIITNFSALVTLFGFVFPFFGNQAIHLTKWQITCIILLFLILIGLIIVEFLTRPKKYKNNEEINNYMYNWIKNTGRTLIFTRDMSWATGIKMLQLLKQKAQQGELILCMPKKSKLAFELETMGAEIIEYSKLNYKPKSRFTMIHYGRTDTKMAIGRTGNNGIHHIEEVQSGVHTEYHLAEDLFEVLKEIKYNEQ